MSPVNMQIPKPRDRDFTDVAYYASGCEAEVYSAVYQQTGQRVAIKVLRPPAARARRTARFVHEASLLREITHPNVVRVYELLDVTLHAEPTRAFVMEWLPRQFGELMKRQPEGIRGTDLGALLHQALSGLEALHARRLAVRGWRPGHLLLSEKGVLKLADLEMVRPEEYALMLESTRYMAPEILDGTIEAGRPEDPPSEEYFASDLYSLGFIFYAAAVGVELWESLPALESVYGRTGSGLGSGERWREWHVDRGKRLPAVGSVRRDLSSSVADVLDRLVVKEQAQRYRSAGEVLLDLGSNAESERGIGAGVGGSAPQSYKTPAAGVRSWIKGWLRSHRRGGEERRH